MQTKNISHNNSNISYRIAGEGKPVMFVHGFAEDSRIWDDIINEFKDRYQLIVPDLPGSGLSSMLEGDAISMEDYADTLKAILDEENIGQVVLIGHSMGGYTSLVFAKKYPHLLKALGLFHSSAYADDEAKKETRRKAINVIKEKGGMAFLKTAIPGLFADAEKSKADIDTLLERGKEFEPEALIQYYEAMIARPDTTEVLKNIQQPVLFILGEHDKAVPFEQGLQQTHLPSIADINILRNSAHMGMLEEKEQSFSILAHFLPTIYV